MKSYSALQIIGFVFNVIAVFSKYYAGKLAFRFFCTPFSGKKFTSKELRFLNSARREALPFKDYELQCYIWDGSGKTIFFAHGYYSNTSRWRPLINLLIRKGYRIIAMDAPAHGESGGKTINGVMYAEAIEILLHKYPADFVIGHSLGGMALVYYFSHLKAIEVERMILMGVPSELSSVVEVFTSTLRFSKRAKEGFYDYFEAYLNFKVSHFSVSSFIQTINIPGLFIADKNDEIAFYEEALAIVKNWSEGELLTTTGLGHTLQGRDVFKAILAHIQSS